MTISVIQSDIVWGVPEANRLSLEAMIGTLTGSDLIVMPEMFSTGFATEPESLAETDGGTLLWMQRVAAEQQCALAGSVAIGEDGCYRNRFYFVKPSGEVAYYDKHHLFTYGGEHLRYTAGEARRVVEYKGVRFLLQVCYDLRFPAWGRNHEDYDVALYVASWPVLRIGAWDTLLRARAIENQAYVVGVNRVGLDPHCSYSGHSAIIDPYGKPLAECEPDTETSVTATLDLSALQAFRTKFPVLKDADQFL